MMWTSNDLLRTAIICTLVLAFKFWLTNLLHGIAKGKAGLRAKEDVNNNPSPTAEDLARADRAGRVASNDAENIPVGLILIWASALCIVADTAAARATDPSYHEDLVKAHVSFTIIFTIVRFIHSVVYGAAMPNMLRTAVYVIGLMAMWGAGIIGAVAAFRKQ